MPNTTEYVDATKLRDFLQCKRLGYWRHRRHYVPVAPQLPLAYGIALHAAEAVFYRGGSTSDMAAAFDAEWGPRTMGEEDAKRNPKKALETIVAYADFYKNDLRDWKILGVEMPGIVPITDDLVWTMILDLLIENMAGRILPIDHKTTSSMNQSFWAGMNPNHQFTGYMNGVRLVSGYKVNMLMVNAIPVSKGRITFTEDCRQVTTRHTVELQRWAKQMVAVWDEVKHCDATNDWPQNDDRCQRWWGGCPYHYLCTTVSIDFMDPANEPSEELYLKEVWDPLEKIREVSDGKLPEPTPTLIQPDEPMWSVKDAWYPLGADR